MFAMFVLAMLDVSDTCDGLATELCCWFDWIAENFRHFLLYDSGHGCGYLISFWFDAQNVCRCSS